MHAYGFVSGLIMALLFFAHLQRSRAQEEAAARLATAQAAQRETRRRLVHSRLQAVQARIDPQLLFEMLDAVRRAYEDDVSRAERLLDELVTFLRAALPRVRSTSSSVRREAHLARAYAQLRTLAGATDIDMTLDVSPEVVDARFPPGVLLPLLDDALHARGGACALSATLSSRDCKLVLTLPARPLDTAVARVRSLLADLYGASAELAVAHADGVVSATVKVPYEVA
jgi:LytS/YehU family sensor histidine kinase